MKFFCKVWKWLFPPMVEELIGGKRQLVTGNVADFLLELEVKYDDNDKEIEKL